jgi:hypothetical protein
LAKDKESAALPVAQAPAPVKPGPPQAQRAIVDESRLKLEGDPGQFAAIRAAFGSQSDHFQSYAFNQVLAILRIGKDDPDVTLEVNAVFAMLAGIAPQNELEGMLAAQMVAAHHLSMRQLQRHALSGDPDQQQAHGNLANKFLRTFSMQVETLAKLRRNGEQVVRHIHVNATQAVIAGTINQTRGEGQP